MKPPRLADRLLRKCVPHGTKGLAILGDLREDYHARVARGQRARWWYCREALFLSLRYMNMTNDMRSAFRSIRRDAWTSSVIVLTLGVAMGASTIGFSFADFAIVRGLPVDDSSRVVSIYGVDARQGNGRARLAPANFRDIRNRATTLTHVAAGQQTHTTLIERGVPSSLDAYRVTADFFMAMGLRPFLGRLFEPGDDEPGSAGVVVLAHQYWQRVHGGDTAIIGRALTIDGRSRTIIGVAPPELEIGNLAATDVWVPLEIGATASRVDRGLSVMARLRDGVSIDQARAEVAAIGKALASEFPHDNRDFEATVLTLGAVAYGPGFWIIIALFVAAVTLVIIIACANAASLVLARATARRREIAVRSALGAGRGRLLRQATVEGIALSLLATIVAVPFAEVGLRVIRSFQSSPELQALKLDAHELGFIGVIALVTPVLFSLLPTLGVIRLDLRTALQTGGTRAIGGRSGGRTALVSMQLSLAVTLLIAAGLALRSAANLAQIDVGMRESGALVFGMDLQTRSAVDRPRRLVTEARARLGALPGVASVHAFEGIPVLGGERIVSIAIDGQAPVPERQPWALLNGSDAEALDAFGVTVMAGRMFTAQEEERGAPVAVMGHTAATMYFGSVERAVGHRITITDRADERPVEIVGVVSDVLGNDLERGPLPRVWTGLHNLRRVTFAVVTRGDPRDLVSAVRHEMAVVAPTIPLDDLESLETAFARFRSGDTVIIGIFAGFALLALLLATTGLYGLITYTVGQRTGEFGTRFALGARPSDVLWLVVVQVARLLGVGLSAGVAGGLAIGYGMRSVLYGVSSVDATTLIGVVTLMAVIAVIASVRPAIRAARVNLVDALRAE